MGAEYITMQKAPNVQLEDAWTKVEVEDRLEVVRQIVRFQERRMLFSFKKFGTLYFAHNVRKQNSQDPLYFDEQGTAIRY